MSEVGGRLTPPSTDAVSIAAAAAECGVSVETFIGWLVESGMLLEHPGGGYVPSPHPDVVELTTIP
ncbi:hypothetical protein [Mycobacterium marinum]|uniref:hypothetical protein n=1 Tax=Mycobacterium marinum TaxID=1781 RepID=UPI0019217793|nr:hypothetical protein [Mycobacterium marinum]QQW33206.1 hypothetical protein HXW97_04660 [Mycobacterium marinum]